METTVSTRVGAPDDDTRGKRLLVRPRQDGVTSEHDAGYVTSVNVMTSLH